MDICKPKEAAGPLCHISSNSEQTKDLNVREKAIKLLEDTDVNLYDFRLGNGFLDMTPKAKGMKVT